MRIFGSAGVAGVMLVFAMATPATAARAKTGTARTAARSQPAGNPAKQLRGEWKVAELKMTREAVDDASFAPDIKQAAINAVEWFLQQQEGLLAAVEKDPKAEAGARKSRAQLETQFNQKMAVIHNDPKLMDELGKRLRALDQEMDDMAAGADKIFAKLDAVGVTAAQKAKIRPMIEDANRKMRNAVAKSKTRSTRDGEVRDEIVTQYKAARARVKQQLTPEQKARLAKKDAE